MKKGQEEIIGFVLIVVIVAVIFLVFLGISIRNSDKVSQTESIDVYQFLETAMEFTTNCSLSSPPDYSRLGELFEECESGNKCHTGITTCQQAEETMTAILDSSWNTQEGSSIKGYEFTSSYGVNGTNSKEILAIKKNSCNGSVRGATYLIPAFPGRIENVLVLC